jgi:hypothetical protein
VEKEVNKGSIPREVIEEGNTYNFSKNGSQSEVLHHVDGTTLCLEEGDAMILPGGLYHDVESTSDSLSITIRFDIPSATSCGALNCTRPFGHWGQHVVSSGADMQVETDASEPVTTKSLFNRWRNLALEDGVHKEIARVNKEQLVSEESPVRLESQGSENPIESEHDELDVD